MSRDNEEIYADSLSDIDSDNCPLSDSNDEESDNGSDTVVDCLRNLGLPVISDSDEDQNSSDEEENEWSQNNYTPDLHNCTEQSGIQISSANLNDIQSCLELIIGDELLNLFATETNRYYHQQNNNSKTNKSKKWTDTNIVEIKRFLGLIITMGFVKKTEKDEYWSTNPLLCTPIFGTIMTRNRFRQIWRYWHFCNNEDCEDRLDKIKPVYTYLTQKFQTVYKPKKELSLDESIIPWRGRLSFRTYNPAKIIKYGILVRMVREAGSGYVCNLEIYCPQRKSLITTIFSVLSPFLNLWHHVYMDSYYNSIKVAEELLKHKTNICGTIRKNRGVPPCLKNNNLKENSTAFRRKGNILIQTWKTKRKLLYMISTIHSADMVEVTHSKTKKKITKPTCVVEYNKYMKGVDRADQYLSYYSILLKTKKWTKKTVLYLLNCALFNAYQLYMKGSGSNIRYKKFLFAVASSWLNVTTETDEPEPSTSSACTKRATKYDPVDRLSSNMKKHRIVRIVGQGKIKNPRRACRVCTTAQKRSSTAFICSSCNVPLHAGKCFENYHTKLKY